MKGLPQKEAAILSLLIEAEDSYGLDLVERSNGHLRRGTVYVTLSRMEDKGLVESWTEPAKQGQQGPPRRRYRVTGEGKAALHAWAIALHQTTPWLANLRLDSGGL
ncbi:MAG: PadR family transcriptional regulator [Rhodothermales bacterium]